MTSPFLRFLDRLPKGYFSGLGFGLISFALAALLFSTIYWALRPFVWAAIYGVPYVSPVGPYSLLSGEWLFVQFIWFLSALVLGRTAFLLSGSKGKMVLLTLAMVWALLTLGGASSQRAEGWRLALNYLQVPLGVALGNILCRGRRANL